MNEKVKQAKNLLDIVEVSMRHYTKNMITTAEEVALNGIRETLTEAEENEKALKIICGKEVGFSQLHYSNNVEDYNNTLHFRFKPSACESMALTQTEFDLVKKVVSKYE